MRKLFKASNFYLLLWIIYYLQGTLYSKGSPISQMSLFLCIGFGIFHYFKVSFSINPNIKYNIFFKWLNRFIVVLSIYGLCSLLFQPLIVGLFVVDNKSFLKDAYSSILPIYSCFYYINKGDWNEKNLRYIGLLLLLLTICRFHSNQAYLLSKIGREEVTNNMGARFLNLMPCLFLFSRKKVVQMILLGVIFVFVIQGFKRGAIFIWFICSLYFIYSTFKSSMSKKQKNIFYFLVIFGIIIAYYYIGNMMESSAYFQKRIEDTANGNSSGRNEIYTDLVNAWIYNFGLLELLFGKGANQTVGIAGNFAHQDWLELLIDCGILGFSVYFFLFLYTFKSLRYIPNSEYKNMFIMSLLIWFMKSFFTMGFQTIEVTMGIWIAYGYYMMNKVKNDI